MSDFISEIKRLPLQTLGN